LRTFFRADINKFVALFENGIGHVKSPKLYVKGRF